MINATVYICTGQINLDEKALQSSNVIGDNLSCGGKDAVGVGCKLKCKCFSLSNIDKWITIQ